MTKRKVNVRAHVRNINNVKVPVSSYIKHIDVPEISLEDVEKVKSGSSPSLFLNDINEFLAEEGLSKESVVDLYDTKGYFLIEDGDNVWMFYTTESFEPENFYFDLENKIKEDGIKEMEDWKKLIDEELLLEDVMDTIEQDYREHGVGDEGTWEELEEGLIEETKADLYGEADRVNGFLGRIGEKEDVNAYYDQFITEEKKKQYIRENLENIIDADVVEIRTNFIAIKNYQE